MIELAGNALHRGQGLASITLCKVAGQFQPGDSDSATGGIGDAKEHVT